MQYKPETVFEYLIVHYRWVFVCIFLLPVSFVFDIWLYLRNWLVYKLSSAPKQHAYKVGKVQQQILDWNKSGRRKKLCTARPGWQTMSIRRPIYKNTLHQIEVNLVDILDIDEDRQIVKCEPLVTIGQLTATLKANGWTLPVVPELEDLTIGGMVMGTGVESSSHIQGFFQNLCLSFELVLSNGEVVTCSPMENSDLFYAVPWSHGTLGILTAVELKIIRAKKYVKLNYEPVRGLKNIVKRFEEINGDPSHEFVEGLMYTQNEAVIMTGNQTDQAEAGKINSIGRWYKSWFFKHAEKALETNKIMTEYIPLRDYYHRHTRSFFWEIKDIIPFGNNWLFRLLFGWLVPPKVSLLKLTQTKAVTKLYDKCHVLQDVLIPMSSLEEIIIKLEEVVKVYPIWLCAFILQPNPGLVHPVMRSPEMYVDVGLYGTPQVDEYETVQSTRAIEKIVRDVNGFQMLYADTYMTRDEFREMFDHHLYDQLRKKYECEDAFPELYSKVCRAARK